MTRWGFLYNIGKLMVFAEQQGIKVICFTFYRSPTEQLIEFNAGRSRVKRGKHQDWLAMDYAVIDDLDANGFVNKDEIRWNNDPRYLILGEYWESLGGIWVYLS